MTDDDIIRAIQRSARTSSASGVAFELEGIAPGGLTQASVISYFKRAFPQIPLRTLIEAGGWRRLSAGELDDADFDALLRPWLPTTSG